MRMRWCLSLCLLPGLLLWSGAFAQPTPPVTPKLQEVELPPPVELPAPDTAEAPAAPITAAEAAAIALHNQPSITIATAGIAAAAGRTRVVSAGLKTQITLSGAYNASDVHGGNGSAPADYQASMSVRQLLHDYNHTRDLVRQAQAQEDLAKAALTTVQADLVLRVKDAFYRFVQDERLIKVAENDLHNRQQHLALAQARLQSGLGLPYDVVRAQTAYSAAVYALTAARTNAVQSRVGLAQLMGLDPRTPLVAADSVETTAPLQTVQELVDEAVEKRPEMAQVSAAILSARYAAAAARTTNFPVVTGSLNLSRRGDEIVPHTGIVTLGVGVQWNAADGGYTKGRREETTANLQAVTAQREALRLQIISDVSETYLDLKTAQQRAITAQAEVTNATESLRLAEGRYRAGLGVFIDVLDAQAALNEANTKLVNTQSEVERFRAALEHATGRNLTPAGP